MRPNILFLLADQLRPDFLGAYGAQFLRTPAIDTLAATGALYTCAISPSPICVPARASLLTGHHAHANGVIDNLSWLRPDRRAMGVATWPERLSQAGYLTSAIGKMHFYPWDASEGFATRVVSEDKRHIHVEDDYHDALVAAGHAKRHGREMPGYVAQKGAAINALPDALQPDRWVANQAAAFLRTVDQPFALMVGFPGPHCPYDPPADALERIDPTRLPLPVSPTRESLSHRDQFVASYQRAWADIDYSALSNAESVTLRRHYAALVERLDEDVATILAALEEGGHAGQTLVIFAADHGDYLGDFGLVGKTTFHEPSVRVPLIVKDPARPAGTVDAPVSLLDVPATILERCGLAPLQLHGRSLDEPDPERVIVGMTKFGTMARGPRHKLVRYQNGVEALFDLVADPCEQTPIRDENARKVLDRAFVEGLLEGTIAGHADKRVPAAQAAPPHPFYRRGWSRPYPQGQF